jgi:hypothetical protein
MVWSCSQLWTYQLSPGGDDCSSFRALAIACLIHRPEPYRHWAGNLKKSGYIRPGGKTHGAGSTFAALEADAFCRDPDGFFDPNGQGLSGGQGYA